MSKIYDRIAHQKAGQQDATVSTQRMHYLGNGDIQLPTRLNAGYRVATLTDHSKGQLLRHMDIPQSFVRSLEDRNPRLANEIINDGLQAYNDKLFWRFSEDRVRGILKDRTPSVDNLSIVESINNVLSIGKSSAFIRSASLDDNCFYLKILFDTEFKDETGIKEGNYLKMGVVCRTSETHHGQLSIKPFVYRWSCTNDAVVATDRAFIAKSFDLPTEAICDGVSSVVAYARLEAANIVNNLVASQSLTIRRPQHRLQELAKENNFSKKETKALIRAYREEPMATQYGIAQAFTRMAQRLTLDERDRIEAIGGSIMMT